jgi:hypothetical protein
MARFVDPAVDFPNLPVGRRKLPDLSPMAGQYERPILHYGSKISHLFVKVLHILSPTCSLSALVDKMHEMSL